jgi:nitrite reductase (NADH) small subunit
MATWHKLLEASTCLPGEGRECVVAGKIIAVFNIAGNFHALDGICPHQGGPLGKGRLQGCLVTCPWHGWQFDVTTGQHQTSKQLVHPRYEVKVESGELWVNLPET